VKIEAVKPDNRRRAFRICAGAAQYWMPYAILPNPPGPGNQVVEVEPDAEIGNEGFTYRLADGTEDTIPLDAVLEYNREPTLMNDLLLHHLTVEALDALEESPLAVRELIRRLQTSPSQFYRLLDTTNTSKSVGQMVALLHLLGRDVELVVKRREPVARATIPRG
jgi:hypothetical protein